MKAFLGLLKWLGILVAIGLVIGLLTCVALWLEWPLMSGVVIVVGIVAVVLLVMGLRHLLLWRNKKRLIAHVMTQDAVSSEGQNALPLLHPFKTAWECGMRHLRRSPLRHKGDPVYAQPWFVMLGERGAGKSTLLEAAGGIKPLGDESLVSGMDTEYLTDAGIAWMFLPELVMLEGHSRYVSTLDAPGEAQNWELFLTMLSGQRTREPLNGVLVTLSLDQLRTESPRTLTDLATNIRNRVQHLTLMLGGLFPIYVVVTKIDQLHGMPSLLSRLPESVLRQPLGCLNDLSCPCTAEHLVQQTLSEVERCLHEGLLEQASQGSPPQGDELLALQELRTLREHLGLFMDTLFQNNPHQPALLARGIFFTGALASTETPEQQPFLTPCFTADIFARVLPMDRKLYRPLEGFTTLHSRMLGLVLGGWYVGLFCLCGLFSLNTLYTWHIFQDTFHKIELEDLEAEKSTESLLPSMEPPVEAMSAYAGKISDPLYKLYLQSSEIERVSHARKIWWLPEFGLSRLQELENKKSEVFVGEFTENHLVPLFQELQQRLVRDQKKISQLERFLLLQRLMWMAKAVHLKQTKGTCDAMLDEPFPYILTADYTQKRQKEIWTPSFGKFFLLTLNRNNKKHFYDQLSQSIESAIMAALNSHELKDLSWIVVGINNNPNLSPIRLERFTPYLAVGDTNAPSVPPAYTRAGYKALKTFTEGLISSCRQNKDAIAAAVNREWSAYYKQYAAVWRELAFNADSVWRDQLRLQVLLDLASTKKLQDTPQARLLTLMGQELSPLVDAKVAPDWVEDIIIVSTMMKLSVNLRNESLESLSSLRILLSAVTDPDSPVWELLASQLMDLSQTRSLFNALSGLHYYFNYLDQLAKVAANPDASFQLAQIHYGGSAFGDVEQSPYTLAEKALGGTMSQFLNVSPEKSPAFFILGSQQRFLAHTVTVHAASVLEQWWGAEVAAPAQLIPADDLPALYGDKGLVTEFVNTRAKAFLKRKVGGYEPNLWQKQLFPFTVDFLSSIQSGQAQAHVSVRDAYDVTLRTQATSVNTDALEKPQSTLVTLVCQKGTVVMENQNYPRQYRFAYTPKECGRVRLDIRFPSVAVSREFVDFPEFVQEFSVGERSFSPQDFPDKSESLNALGVRDITVRMMPDSVGDLSSLQEHRVMPILPERITFSW